MGGIFRAHWSRVPFAQNSVKQSTKTASMRPSMALPACPPIITQH